MTLTIISLHRSGWTIQTFSSEEQALKTWKHATTLGSKVLASTLYRGAECIKSYTAEVPDELK